MLRRNTLKTISIICLTLLCIACTPPPSAIAPQNEIKSFEHRKLELSDLQKWRIKGAIAVKEARQGFSASLNWLQFNPSSFSIQLFGPLGSGNLKLIQKGSNATLIDGDKRYTSNDSEQLLLKHSGYLIPVKSLFYWIRGLPAPTSSATKKTDNFGHLSQLMQQGWVIHYNRFTSYKGLDVPSKLTLLKQNIKVKIVINRWG